jgi:hypothetical protein
MPKEKVRHSKSKSIDMNKYNRFIEELAWLLASYSDLDWKNVSLYSKHASSELEASVAVGGYVSSNPNKHFMVGVLPRLFSDPKLFPTNEDIANFAMTVMNLKIPRFHKISKYEIIGHIVCQTDTLDDKELSKLVRALGKIAEGDETTRNLIKQRKEENFAWNYIIQELAGANK